MNTNSESIEQVEVYIMMKEIVMGHQIFPKCVDLLLSSLANRLRVVEMKLEKDQTMTKQSKVNSGWLKKARNKLMHA